MVGFADFFPELREAPNNVLNNMRNAGTVTIYNSTLLRLKFV